MTTRSRRRSTPWWWLTLAAAASVVVIILASVPWYRVGTLTLSGRQTTGQLVPVLGYAALALVGLSLTLSRRAQRVSAAALFVLGIGQIGTGWTRHRPSTAQLAQWGASGTGAPTWAWLGLLIAGVATCVAAVGIAVTGTAGGNRDDRFERRPTAAGDPSLAAWRAMDAGLDPTADDEAAYPHASERGNLSRSRFTSENEGPDHEERAQSAPTKTQRKGRDD